MGEQPKKEEGERASVARAEPKPPQEKKPENKAAPDQTEEIGGPKGPEPTRYGDWEKGGRCSDF